MRFPTVFDDAQGHVWLTSRDGLFRLAEGEFRPVLSADINNGWDDLLALSGS